MTPELDIVIPVYNEGCNIVATLSALAKGLTTPARVLICYDHADDDTLPARPFARLPPPEARNGFRLSSRRVIDRIVVESDQGFCYSIELLVKAHRLGWRIGEVPTQWFQRRHGESRFRVFRWLPAYLR